MAQKHIEQISRRAVNMLRAVRDGRGQLTLSSEPDLYVDGLPCCDQSAARELMRFGLIRHDTVGGVSGRVPALVTNRGTEALAALTVQLAS